MKLLSIDGHMLRKAIIAGTNELEKRKDYVDSLNVFPVPDGDTGINMSLTVLAAGREVSKLNTPNIHEIAKAASGGSLRGARGNSGVMLSQLFRGFAKGLEGKDVATAKDLAHAFQKASETAYKAVMKPKEGTILTLARSFAEVSAVECQNTDDILEMMKRTIKAANKVLEQTREMLPELKQAGVVDSGARGLLYIIEGAFAVKDMKGEVELTQPSGSKSIGSVVNFQNAAASAETSIKFAYCTEFFINVEKDGEAVCDNVKDYLSSIGDSVVVVGDEEIIKVHVHTNRPGLVLEKAIRCGYLSNLKIENMKLQHTNLINFSRISNGASEAETANNAVPINEVPFKEVGFIAVSSGEGLNELFRSLGADVIIEGGQTMNPSADDILSAINQVNAEKVVILPNNKNIVLAAKQAVILSDKRSYVVPSKSIPQGISSLIFYSPDISLEENMENMKSCLPNIITGEITYAVRSTAIDGKEIEDGDVLCMIEGKISNVAKDVEAGAREMIDLMFTQKPGDVMSIYYGKDVTEEQASAIAAYVSEKYPGCETAILDGGQPLYYYIISLE